MMTGGNFKKRALWLIAFFCCWTIFILFNYLYYAYWQRQYYLIQGNKLSCREGIYTAGRGRILDCNGVPLAWSERHYDLYILDLPGSPEYRKQLINILTRRIGDLSTTILQDENSIIKQDLSPTEVDMLRELIPDHPSLKIKFRIVRRVIEFPEVRQLIGNVEFDGKVLKGASGCEKLYDKELSGTPGKYKIMLDRNKNWIPGTFTCLVKAVPGRDVRLKRSLEEIRNNHSGKPKG